MLTTAVHLYDFDISIPEEKYKYDELVAHLRAEGYHKHSSWSPGGKTHYERTKPLGEMDVDIELDTDHLFSNQWNTKPIPGISETGMRLFDWAEDVNGPHVGMVPNMSIRRGYYLDLVDEHWNVRRNRLSCGFCGNQYEYDSSVPQEFCHKCLGSEYLREDEIHLTRLLPVDAHLPTRKPLTKEEIEYMVEDYHEAQRERLEKWAVIEKERIKQRHANDIEKANRRYDGDMWVLQNVPSLFKNHIQYDDRAAFGWQNPLTEKEVEELMKHVESYPGKYEIRTDGKTIVGG